MRNQSRVWLLCSLLSACAGVVTDDADVDVAAQPLTQEEQQTQEQEFRDPVPQALEEQQTPELAPDTEPQEQQEQQQLIPIYFGPKQTGCGC
jgi:hypothetical protein